MEYHAYYKCRLCGEVYHDGTVTGNKDLVFRGMIELSVMGKGMEPMFPNMTNAHYCEDGSYGLADFAGFKAINKE